MPATEKKNRRQTISEVGNAVAAMVAIACLYGLGGHAAVWLFPTSEWAYKWRFVLDDDLAGATVSIDQKPHDCEFLTAPMGTKNCHYDKRILTVRIRNGPSGRLLSLDEGKTWSQAEASAKSAVYVSWEKVVE